MTRGRRSLLAGVLACAGSALAAPAARADVAQCAAAADEGQRLRDEAKYRSAREQFVRCGNEECPPSIRRDCVQWLAEVNQAAPSIVVRARSAAGADLDNVKVIVDGETIAERIDGKPISVDPGPHTIRGQGSGAETVEQRVIIQTGEKNRLIELHFGGAKPDAPNRPRAAVDDHGGSTGQGGSAGALPWIVGGAGVLALGGATLFAAIGLSERSDLRSQPCAANATCSQDDVDSVHAKLLTADVLAIVGVAAIGVATYLFLTSKPEQTKRSVLDAGVFTGLAPGRVGVRF